MLHTQVVYTNSEVCVWGVVARKTGLIFAHTVFLPYSKLSSTEIAIREQKFTRNVIKTVFYLKIAKKTLN